MVFQEGGYVSAGHTGMIRNKNGYINDTAEPLYYFGHGLSYTEFTYSDLQTDKKNINPDDTVKVTFSKTQENMMARKSHNYIFQTRLHQW